MTEKCSTYKMTDFDEKNLGFWGMSKTLKESQFCPKESQSRPKNKYLVAHNNDGFDRIFLQNQLKKYDYNCQSFEWKYIDTLLLAKKLLPNISSYSLKALLIYFKLPPMNTHRALDDTKALRLLYHELCKILAKKINLSYEDIIKIPSSVYKYLYC